jgi:hypothetical protein
MQLAQINIAKLKYSIDAPEVAEFVDNLDKINALAEASEGFIWRLKDESGNATAFNVFGDERIIVNISVWSGIESLHTYVYRSSHSEFLGKRNQWFKLPKTAHLALWWIDDNDYPSAEDGRERIYHLREHGPTAYAFTLKKRFEATASRQGV